MTDLRLVIAQVLAGVTLAIVLTIFIMGPEVMMTRLFVMFGTTQVGDFGTGVMLVLSATTFVLSLKRRSFLVAGLLVASGAIFLMSPMRAMEHFASEGAMGVIHVGSFGIAILGLGVAQGVGTARLAAKTAVTWEHHDKENY